MNIKAAEIRCGAKFSNFSIYDVLSIAYFNLGKYKLSLKYVKLALSMDKNNERLLNNLEIIKQKEKDVFKG